jgi:hypothetical protein
MENKPSKKEIKDDLSKISALEAVKNSEGGKILIESCLADVVSSVDTLCVGYTSLNHIELVAHCARLKERLDLYRVLVNAKRNKKMVLEALKEALEEDPDM